MSRTAAKPQISPEVETMLTQAGSRPGNDVVELMFLELEQKRADAKRLYAEIDQIEATLIRAVGLNGEVTTGDGRRIHVEDNFWDYKKSEPKNVSWKPCGVKRFEIVAD